MLVPDDNKQQTAGQCGVLVTVENSGGYTSSGNIDSQLAVFQVKLNLDFKYWKPSHEDIKWMNTSVIMD